MLPNNIPSLGEPKQSAVIITTDSGERLAYPQVAVAMISPDVAKAIAEAVWLRINKPEEFYATAAPEFEEAREGDELENQELVQAG